MTHLIRLTQIAFLASMFLAISCIVRAQTPSPMPTPRASPLASAPSTDVPAATPEPPQDLLPNQTIEREMTGAETHRYKLELKANEFFQVRVEQKGVDVALKLLDATGVELATMDSPNGTEGSETLTWVSLAAGRYVLEVVNFDEKLSKGAYAIKREATRAATAMDVKRVNVERDFYNAIIGLSDTSRSDQALTTLEQLKSQWSELGDEYLADLTERQIEGFEFNSFLQLVTDGQQLMRRGTKESVGAARAKFLAAVEPSRAFVAHLNDKNVIGLLTPEVTSDLRAKLMQNEAIALFWIGKTYAFVKDWEANINYDKQALAVIQAMRDAPDVRGSKYFSEMPYPLKAIEADISGDVGANLADYLGRPREGRICDTRALDLWRDVARENTNLIARAESHQAMMLAQLAQSYPNDAPEKLIYLQQSLTIFERYPDQERLEGVVLIEIGNFFDGQLDFESSLRVHLRALAIFTDLGDKPGQSFMLTSLGTIYMALNNEAKARDYFRQALAILLSDDYVKFFEGRKPSEPSQLGRKEEDYGSLISQKEDYLWARYSGAGNIYRQLGESDNELAYFKKSLEIAYASKNLFRIRFSLGSIGDAYVDRKDWQNALIYYKQTLDLSRQLPDKNDLAGDLSSLAYLYFQTSDWQNALRFASEATLTYQSIGAGGAKVYVGYSTALSHLARIEDALGNRRLAIFYGKAAVNTIQRERQQLRKLDPASQRGYLQKNEKAYRRLAGWLIAEGRIAEAEEVLALLKQDEYLQYVRGGDKVADEMLPRVSVNDPEREAIKRFDEIADRITAIGKEEEDLEAEKARWQAQVKAPSAVFPRQSEIDAKEGQLIDARTVFLRFKDELNGKFGNRRSGEPSQRVGALSRTELILAKLKQPRTVIISTIVGDDHLNLIVSTSKISRAHTVAISAEKLNDLVEAFREAVKDSRVDPRPAAKALYDVLFPADVLKDLNGARADTIVWSLDGTLRYAPIAALWDGEHYLAERYANSVITLATNINTDLSSTPLNAKTLTAVGVGVSQPVTFEAIDGTIVRFSALPAVPQELCGVVNDPRANCIGLSGGRRGVIVGDSLLDSAFTFSAFKDELGKHPIVHVASHFNLNPGDYGSSYLVLGGGNSDERKLTLQKVRVQLNGKFEGVDLLTLSACNTAMSAGENPSNGIEVESFGALAQELGAKSVLASLWSVSDPSTRDFMVRFYELYGSGMMTKTKALQKAQQEMMAGTLKPTQPVGRHRDTGEIEGVTPANAPPYVADPRKPFAHPYYWAPFVLYGNWR